MLSLADRPIIFLDLEMTGLNPLKDKIIEIGFLVTDERLNIVFETDPIIVNVEEETLQGMDEWN